MKFLQDKIDYSFAIQDHIHGQALRSELMWNNKLQSIKWLLEKVTSEGKC